MRFSTKDDNEKEGITLKISCCSLSQKYSVYKNFTMFYDLLTMKLNYDIIQN